jgi:arylsulfatase A-like enzyme
MVPRLLVLLSVACRATPRAEALSNIIHIMGDDVGWNDLGYHNKLIPSPWIDKLALGGVRLTNHHAFKVCAPSRSGFHTGRLPWQMGYYDNSAAATPWEPVDANKLGADTRFKLLPQLLAAKGYVSHAIGKWHLGCATRAYTPTYRGYASFLGYYHAMTEDYWAHTHSTGKDCPGPGLGASWSDMSNNTGAALGMSPDNGTYESVLFGDQAVRTIGAHAHVHEGETPAPLFMYIAFHNEHDPHQAPKAAIDAFEATIRSDTYKVTARGDPRVIASRAGHESQR